MKIYKFDAVIKKVEGIDAGYVEFPYDAEKEFGTKSRVKVKAAFDGFEYRGSLVKMGQPRHWIGLNKEVRTAIGKKPGDKVSVTIQQDTEERIVDVPGDLTAALAKHPDIRAIFSALSYTHRKEYVRWITEAKKDETRKARIQKTIEMLRAKKNR